MADDLVAIAVAVIGVAGTVGVAILTVFWQAKKERDERNTKRSDLYRALYSELARVMSNLITIRSQIEENEEWLKKWAHLTPEGQARLKKIFQTISGNKIDFSLYKLAKEKPDLAVLFYSFPEAYIIDSIYESVGYFQDKLTKEMWLEAKGDVAQVIDTAKDGIRDETLHVDVLLSCCVLDRDKTKLTEALAL